MSLPGEPLGSILGGRFQLISLIQYHYTNSATIIFNNSYSDEIQLKIRCCSCLGGNLITVFFIVSPEIALKVEPVALLSK